MLAQKININHALYVGHLPHLEKLATYLVTGNENDNIIKFQNSAVLCLEKSDSHFQLRRHLTPELTGY
jgi:phosphohistidine phosphatase